MARFRLGKGRAFGKKPAEDSKGRVKKYKKSTIQTITEADLRTIQIARKNNAEVKKLEGMFRSGFSRVALENPEMELEEIWVNTMVNVAKAHKALPNHVDEHFNRMNASMALLKTHIMREARNERRMEQRRRGLFEHSMKNLGLTEINQQRAARESYNEITGWLRLKEGNPVDRDLIGEVARTSQVKYHLPYEDATKITDLFFYAHGGHHILRPEFEELRAGKPKPKELIPKKGPKQGRR